MEGALCRLADAFVAALGVQSLALVLDKPLLGPGDMHLALACLDGLTLASMTEGCEAVLGWRLPQPAEGEGLLENGHAFKARSLRPCSLNIPCGLVLATGCGAVLSWHLPQSAEGKGPLGNGHALTASPIALRSEQRPMWSCPGPDEQRQGGLLGWRLPQSAQGMQSRGENGHAFKSSPLRSCIMTSAPAWR